MTGGRGEVQTIGSAEGTAIQNPKWRARRLEGSADLLDALPVQLTRPQVEWSDWTERTAVLLPLPWKLEQAARPRAPVPEGHMAAGQPRDAQGAVGEGRKIIHPAVPPDM